MVGAPTHAPTGLRLREVSMRAWVEVTAPCGRCRRRIARPEHVLLRTRELQIRKAESSRTAVAAPVLQSKDALGTHLSARPRQLPVVLRRTLDGSHRAAHAPPWRSRQMPQRRAPSPLRTQGGACRRGAGPRLRCWSSGGGRACAPQPRTQSGPCEHACRLERASAAHEHPA